MEDLNLVSNMDALFPGSSVEDNVGPSTGVSVGGGIVSSPSDTVTNSYTNPDSELQNVTDGPGSQTVIPEVEGDLGARYLNYSTFLMLQEALRKSSTFNGLRPYNHRFRGHRESNKFNLTIQKILTICGSLYLQLKTWDTALQSQEVVDMYPEEAEIQAYYHCNEQIRFKEWLLLKDEDKRWFV